MLGQLAHGVHQRRIDLTGARLLTGHRGVGF
jgi:hypothetical protein